MRFQGWLTDLLSLSLIEVLVSMKASGVVLLKLVPPALILELEKGAFHSLPLFRGSVSCFSGQLCMMVYGGGGSLGLSGGQGVLAL